MLMKREATSIGKSGTAYARTTLPAACGWGLPCLRCYAHFVAFPTNQLCSRRCEHCRRCSALATALGTFAVSVHTHSRLGYTTS